jgi:hypothetical protein
MHTSGGKSMRKNLIWGGIANVLVVITLLLCSCAIAEGGGKNSMITEIEARVSADNEALRLGYIPKEMKVILDCENLTWNQYLVHGGSSIKNLDLKRQLEGRRFWAIYYEPPQGQVGGDLFVFVDKDTGQIIGHLRGQ